MTSTGSQTLVIRVRLHDGRFHGTPEWPPAPARLFQALVAGAGPVLTKEAVDALEWLEGLPPPLVGAPTARSGNPVQLFVPNNDLDKYGGDPKSLPSVRVAKVVRPRCFEPSLPFLYAWPIPANSNPDLPQEICRLALRLYQFGRGIDMAFAEAELVASERFDAELSGYAGRLHRPTPGSQSTGVRLACPEPGSLPTLDARYRAASERLKVEGKSKKAMLVFEQPPKAKFIEIAYDSPPSRAVYEFQPVHSGSGRLSSAPIDDASTLVVRIRDAASDRLKQALPAAADAVERFLIGKTVRDVAATADERIRLVPLPSIGHPMVDRGIRRFLVEVPQGGALRAEDVFWAFSGMELPLAPDREPVRLVRSNDAAGMLTHYGVQNGDGRAERKDLRIWRTVTPAALPESARRRRIDPNRMRDEAKSGPERVEEEKRASFAVQQALRHTGVRERPLSIRVQREPFEAKGARAEAFAPDTRFVKERLWHVEVQFREPVSGPLLIGDGRFLGLGVMAPSKAEFSAGE